MLNIDEMVQFPNLLDFDPKLLIIGTELFVRVYIHCGTIGRCVADS